MASSLCPEEAVTLVIGICGACGGGKTTLAEKLVERHSITTVIHQDDFYKDYANLPVSEDGKDKMSWDVVEAVKVQELVVAVQLATSQATCWKTESQFQNSILPGVGHLVIVEGTMLLGMRKLSSLFNAAYFITLDYDTMRERRSKRDYDSPDPPGYFEDHVWPAYMRDMKVACGAHEDGTVRMLNGCNDIIENLKEIELRIHELVQTGSQRS